MPVPAHKFATIFDKMNKKDDYKLKLLSLFLRQMTVYISLWIDFLKTNLKIEVCKYLKLINIKIKKSINCVNIWRVNK